MGVSSFTSYAQFIGDAAAGHESQRLLHQSHLAVMIINVAHHVEAWASTSLTGGFFQ